MKHAYYPALDGLRTIAVGIVICAHGGVPWFRSGGVGVDVFFVLSGFLITTILSGEWARTGTISFRNFYARRFLRLAPALLLTCLLVGIAKPLFGEAFPRTDILLALSYTANWAQALYGYYMTWLNHCWSLAIEEQFYLLWPLVIVGLERTGRSPGAKSAILITGAAGIAIYRAWHVGTWTDERLNFGLDTRMDSLMVGAALAYLVTAWANTPRRCAPPLSRGDHEPNRSPLERGPGAVGPAKAAAQGAGCVGAVRRGPAGAEPSTFEPRLAGTRAIQVLPYLAPVALLTLFLIPRIVTWYSPWMGWIGYVIVAGLAATVLLDLVISERSFLARGLATRPMEFIGKISYGLYLLHLPVFFAVEKVIPQAPLVVRLGWKVAISLTLATASYYLVEKRFLALKSRFER